MVHKRSHVVAGMDYTSQVIAGMEYVSQDIAGMDYRCQVIAGMDNKSQVITGMEYVNQVIPNCYQAIRQLLSAQLSQSDARDRRTNNFTSAGAQLSNHESNHSWDSPQFWCSLHHPPEAQSLPILTWPNRAPLRQFEVHLRRITGTSRAPPRHLHMLPEQSKR